MTLKNMTTTLDFSVVFPFVLPQTMLTNNYFSEIKERSTSQRINGAILCYILYMCFFFDFPGDILIFMPGQEDIEVTCDLITG